MIQITGLKVVDLILVDMDQEGSENPLYGEEAYFDGFHLQCVSYKTLAFYHPAMQCILRIATMEVKTEST